MTRPDPTMRGNVISVVIHCGARGADLNQAAAEQVPELVRAALLKHGRDRRAATLTKVDNGHEGWLLTVSTDKSLSVTQWRRLLSAAFVLHDVKAHWESAMVIDFVQSPDAEPSRDA